jgi:hypothetical protein
MPVAPLGGVRHADEARPEPRDPASFRRRAVLRTLAQPQGTITERVFTECPWGREKTVGVFCYECHELLLHNLVLLPEDVKRLSALVRKRGLSEDEKSDDYARIAGRITLFHDVIVRGLASFEMEET